MNKNRIIFGAALLLVLLLFAVAMMKLWLPTQYKVFRHNFSAISDYQLFDNRLLPSSNTPLRLDYCDQAQVSGMTGQFDPFLKQHDTVAFVILRDGCIAYEQYFQGYSEGSLVTLYSVSKAITSLIVGLALEDELIHSLDQRVTDFIPEFSGSRVERIQIRHLLSMTSGLPYRERTVNNPFGLHAHLTYTDDTLELLHKIKLGKAPGSEFAYKSVDYALLGIVLSRALKRESITDYLNRKLWQPMGMAHRGLFAVDSALNGQEKTWCCLSATARDLAKIGQLLLNRGRWHDQQLVSADWIALSTKPDSETRDSNRYRFGWWLMPQTGDAFRAEGILGQFLYVNRDQNLVAVRLGRSRGGLDWSDWTNFFTSLNARHDQTRPTVLNREHLKPVIR